MTFTTPRRLVGIYVVEMFLKLAALASTRGTCLTSSSSLPLDVFVLDELSNGELGLLGGNEAGVDLGNGETVFWVPALYDPSWQPQQGGYVALLYDPTTSGKVNQRHVINNPQAVLMLLRKQINARRLAVLKARAPAIDRGGRGDDELAA